MAEEIRLSFGFCWKHLKTIDPQKMIERLNIYRKFVVFLGPRYCGIVTQVFCLANIHDIRLW